MKRFRVKDHVKEEMRDDVIELDF